MIGGWTMSAYFFRSEPGAAELRRVARRESGRVCQRVLMIANMLEGMEHEAAARLAGLSRSAAYEWHNRYEEEGIEGLRDRPRLGRQPRVDAATSARFKERIGARSELTHIAWRVLTPLAIDHASCNQCVVPFSAEATRNRIGNRCLKARFLIVYRSL